MKMWFFLGSKYKGMLFGKEDCSGWLMETNQKQSPQFLRATHSNHSKSIHRCRAASFVRLRFKSLEFTASRVIHLNDI